jgi:hypothetical protein
MRDIPKKNCWVAGSMALFSAACLAGAAYFYSKDSHRGLAPLYIVLAMSQAGLGTVLLIKATKS